jgi:nitrogen regulatory protein PII
MKLIMAILQPARYEIVLDALQRVGVHGITVSDVRGAGHLKGPEITYRGASAGRSLVPLLKMEIAVDDDVVSPVVEAIIAAGRRGRQGRIGDGKILVLPLEEVARIRTGESGAAAL